MQAATGRAFMLVIGKLGPAGKEMQLLHLARGLAERGHKVTVACIGRSANIDLSPLTKAGVELAELGATSPRARAAVMPRLIRMARAADLVHCTAWDASLWGRLAAVAARRPCVITEHTPGRETQKSAGGAPRGSVIALHNRLLDPFTYATVVVAHWQMDLLRSEGVAPAKIVHIPNAIPVDRLREASRSGASREQLGVPDAAKLVIHLARFRPQKNQPRTYDTVASLREELGDVHVAFVGDGPGREELERRARDAGAAWAHFLGRRKDVARLLTLADLSVLPSSAEAMPMSALEAMALGVPQVVSDVGDLREMVEGTDAGLCVPAGDWDAFREACRALLADDERARQAAERALAASKAYDAPVMTTAYERLFEAALAGRGPG